MIEVTLREIIEGTELLGQLSTKPLKSKAAYQVGRILREVQNEFNLYNEKRIALLEKYAEKNEGGKPIIEDGNYKLSQEDIIKINEEHNELIDTKVSINANALQLSLIDEESFTPTEMLKLMPFIEE